MAHPITLDLYLDVRETRYTLEEAIDLIHRIQLQIQSLEDYRLKLKWWMGCILAHTDRTDCSREQLVEEVADRLRTKHGIRAGRTVLLRCLKLYTVLNGDYKCYLEWIEARKRLFARPVYWYDVVNDLLGGKNNPAVIGREAADQADFRDAELAIEALERVIVRASEGSEEAQGVVEGIRQSMVGLMLLAGGSKRTARSRAYLEFVASCGCFVCGRPAEPHHALGQRGTGIKPSDFGCVPLCRLHHRQLHQSGFRHFERFHGVMLTEVALNLLHRFVTGNWLTMHVGRDE